MSKLKSTAQILYIIYLALFAIFALLYFLAGMPLFDSLVIAMGTAGTGGFTVYNDGIAHYNSSLITYLVSFGVLAFGVNFNLYYYLLIRKFKACFGDEELRGYLWIVFLSTSLIAFNVFHLYQGFAKSVEFPSSRFPISSQRLDSAMVIRSSGPSFLRSSCFCSCVSGARPDQPLGDSRSFGGLSFPALPKIKFSLPYHPIGS